MTILHVETTNTFDEFRQRTNDVIDAVNDIENSLSTVNSELINANVVFANTIIANNSVTTNTNTTDLSLTTNKGVATASILIESGSDGSIILSSIGNGQVIATSQIASTVSTGTSPFTVSSNTLVNNLNSDKVDGKDIGTLTAAGGIIYATSTTSLQGTGSGTSGQAVISGGSGAPTFQNVSSANGASSIVARDSNGSFSANVVNATAFSGSGVGLTNIPNSATTATPNNVGLTIVSRDASGDFTANIITATSFSGSGVGLTNIPNSATTSNSANGASTIVARDASGSFSANIITATTFTGNANASIITSGIISTDRLASSGTANANTYLRGDQTWAFIPDGQTSGSTEAGYLKYNGTTLQAGQLDGGTSVPSGTIRLNYNGYLYATRFYGDGSNVTSINANNISTGTVSTARLASGTASSSTFLRGDQTWAPAGVTVLDDTANNYSVYPALSPVTNGTLLTALVSSTKLYFNPFTGTLSATNLNSLSDLRLKEDVYIIENAVSTISKINGVEFKWKENNKKSYGVIAQELEKILPELVDGEDTKTVNYSGLIAFLINAVKELDDRLQKLES